MAKEEMEEKEPKGEKRKEGGKEEKGEKKGGEKGRKHLHEMRITQAHDGTLVHHVTYKKHKDDQFAEPERGPVATSSDPKEAGQQVEEMFGQNQMGEEQGAQGGEGEEGAEQGAGAMPGA